MSIFCTSTKLKEDSTSISCAFLKLFATCLPFFTMTEPEFSINIYNAAYYELDFVKQIGENKILKDPEVVKISLYRYEKLWLPFLHNFSKDQQNDLDVLPPLDVHWIWHTHMLAPTQYESDCRQQGVNFTNILRGAFSYKSLSSSFSVLTF